MGTFLWASPNSGTFETAADWSGDALPGSGDDALLTVAGANYTVTTTAGETVNSLQTAANATLAVGSGVNFSMTNGTGSGANAGQISVSNNAYLYVGGTFDNTSTVTGGGVVLNGVANTTDLRLVGATTTFTGGGSVVLATGGNNVIVGDAGASNTLVNVNNTFSGVGNIGAGNLTLVNQTAGVIDANQTGVLTLQVNGGVTNTGLLEATNTGGLVINGASINNVGGTILATGSGSHVDLQSMGVTGGTLTAGAGAQIDLNTGDNSTFDGSSAVTITSGTNVNALPGSLT